MSKVVLDNFMQVISSRWSAVLELKAADRDWLELRYILHGAILALDPADVGSEFLDDLQLLYYIARDRSMYGLDF